MAKGINIPLNISGLKQAKEDLVKLNDEFEAAKKRGDDKATKELAKQYNALSKEIDKTTDQLLEMNKAGKLVGTRFDDLNEVLFDTQQEILPLSSQIGEMEDRMYQLAAAGDTSSAEFKSLQGETVRLRKVIIDTDKSIDLLAENQGLSVFAEGWSQVGNSILSLNFEQAAKDADRLNGAVGNLGQIGKSSLTGLIKTVGSLSKTFIKFGLSLLLNPFFLIPAAIAGLIAGISYLIGGIDGVKKAFEFLFKPIKWVIDLFKQLTDWLGLTNFKENELKEARVARHKANMARLKEERSELDKNRQANEKRAALEKRWSDERIKTLELDAKEAEINGKSVAGINEKLTAEKIAQYERDKEAYIQSQKDILAQNKNTEAQLLSTYNNRTGNTAKVGKQLNEIRERNAKLEQQIATDNFQQLYEIDQQIREVNLETAAQEKASLEERRAKYKEYQDDRLSALRQIQDLELELMEEGTEKDLAAINLKYDRLIEDTKSNEKLKEEEKDKITKYYESLRAAEEGKRLQQDLDNERKKIDALRKVQEDATLAWLAEEEELSEVIRQAQQTDLQNEIDSINEKYFQLIESAKAHNLETEALEAEHQAKLDAIREREAKAEIERNQAVQDAKLNMAIEGLSLISSATELFGKKNEKNAKRAFEVNKAAQIAQAVISTYQGANAIFASAAANPATVLFPAQPFIAAGLAVASGLVNVAKIAQTKFEGGSVPSGGGGSAPSIGGGGGTSTQASTPSFSLFGQSNNLDEAKSAESVETSQMIEVKAVVSETEVTGTQEKVKNIKESAEL